MNRRDILPHACDLYLQGGIEAVSMRRLARDLGVTAPALYRHYASREEILLEVVSESYRLCAEHLSRALSGRTPAERFHLTGEGYLNFALRHPKFYEMMHAPAHTLGAAVFPADLMARMDGVGQFFNDRVRECIEAELLRPLGAQEISLTLWAHAHGLISIYLRGCLHMDEEAFRLVFHESNRRIMHGMVTPLYEATQKDLPQDTAAVA
ncbi:MAG: TetR/AcrR family transcriptional regulator [bacterium]|nr:TetR/AcrR family transcriptional regulator [bacterium]